MKKKKKKLTSTKTAKKRFYNPSLVWSRHEHAEPLLHSTSGSSISMNIRIGRSRYLKMNDVIYSGNIKTTSCNIRRKENRVWRVHESNSSKKKIKWIQWGLIFIYNIIIITHLSRFFSRWRCSNWECSGKALILSSSTSGMSLRMPSIEDKKTSDLPGYRSKK